MSGLRGAIIGCGFFARNHLNAWNDVVGAKLVAVCDLDPAKAEAAAALTGARPYTDARAMLAAEELDFVDIATTMESHEALMALAAEHKLAAICQKPFAPDLAAVRRILDRAEAAGRPIMVHENFRFQTPLIAVQKIVASGAIGRPFFAHISWRTGYDVVAGQPYLAKTERFILLDLGIHVLDVARFLLGEVREIYARTRKTMPIAIGESQATMLLTHADGALSEVVCSYTTRIDPDPFPQTLIEIDGEEGSLRLLRDYRIEIHRGGKVEVQEAPPRRPTWADPQWALAQESVLTTQQHWVDCLREGREPSTSGRDNLKTFALVEAAYASAASGQPATPEA
jgi:predicted dehydrogenase